MNGVPHHLMMLSNVGSAISGVAVLLAVAAMLLFRKHADLVAGIAAALLAMGLAFMVPAAGYLKYGAELRPLYACAAVAFLLASAWIGYHVQRRTKNEATLTQKQ